MTDPRHSARCTTSTSTPAPRFTDFAGWQMPVRYTLRPRRAPRRAHRRRPVRHLATWPRSSSSAPRPARSSTTRSPASSRRIADGQAKYTPAARRERRHHRRPHRLPHRRRPLPGRRERRQPRAVVADALRERCAATSTVDVEDESDDIALIAVQGPTLARRSSRQRRRASTRLGRRSTTCKYYRAIAARLPTAHPVLVARTGYTGEDGFELYVAPDAAAALWDA